MSDSIRVSMVSLGCSKNQVDAESMLYTLKDSGFELSQDPAQADVIIVNTCGFIQSAKEEAIETILEMAEYKKTARCKALIATGCLAQRYAKDLRDELPEVDGILGVTQYPEIASFVRKVLTHERVIENTIHLEVAGSALRVLTTPPWMAYLKIAEGCDNRCSYCAIPAIRGSYRSRPMDELIRETEALSREGVRELILIAQDTTRYGTDLYGEPMLTKLLESLSGIDGLHWIRVMYCYPEMVDRKLLDTILHEPKICRYLDVPIQHIDDDILRRMNRRSDSRQIRAMVNMIQAFPEPMALRTSIIVGFPGENGQAFQQLLDFIGERPFNHLGAFVYSAEEGTSAESMPNQVPKRTSQRRLDKLMMLQQQVSLAYNKKMIGTMVETLVESKREDGCWVGRSQYHAPDIDGQVIFTGPEIIEPGRFVSVHITDVTEYDWMGEWVDVAGE